VLMRPGCRVALASPVVSRGTAAEALDENGDDGHDYSDDAGDCSDDARDGADLAPIDAVICANWLMQHTIYEGVLAATGTHYSIRRRMNIRDTRAFDIAIEVEGDRLARLVRHAPQHFLYFRPEPQEHGRFRPVADGCGWWTTALTVSPFAPPFTVRIAVWPVTIKPSTSVVPGPSMKRPPPAP
jgi:hypothetical protein